MGSAQAEALRRRLRLLAQSDQLLGLKDWPVDERWLASASSILATESTAGGPPAADATQGRQQPAGMSTKASQSRSSPAPRVGQKSTPSAEPMDPERRARLEALITQFPPEIEPPGIEPKNRPDALHSAQHALKGSPVDVVRLKAEALAKLAAQVKECQRCGLWRQCTQRVFGVGHPDARIVFVGEAPGAEEDRLGYPFVGRAGALLTAMVERGMGLRREHVYICNVVKCRPPENRTPTTDEIAACQEHLWAQLTALEPQLLVALGLPAAQTLLGTKLSLNRLRGQFYDVCLSGSDLTGGPVTTCIPTYHPAYLLRNPADKKKAWEDLKKVMGQMGIPAQRR